MPNAVIETDGAYQVSEHQDVVIRAVITRADGRVQDVGIIHANYSNPLKRLWWKAVGLHMANRRIRWANRHKES